MPFMRMIMKVRKSPSGFLGGLPGPEVWKQSRKTFLAKLKSTFLKRVSRVSCSSCLAGTHLPCVIWFTKYETPILKISFSI